MEVVLRFIGVTVMALIAANTLRIVCELIGPRGWELIRDARERQDQKDTET